MLTLQDVLAARERIRGIVGVTPCPLSEPFSELCGARIHFKLENVHRTGSFKERGAANKFSLLAPEERKRGAVAAAPSSTRVARMPRRWAWKATAGACVPARAASRTCVRPAQASEDTS